MTSYHLVTLCHNYGRRTRAMAYSLNHCDLTDISLTWTIFYSRQEDYDMIKQEIGNVKASFIRKPVEEILRRSIYYHELPDQPCDYTAYVDGDLWFPKNFWIRFTESLKDEDPGYWACPAINIPKEHAEELVDNYKSITPLTFVEYSTLRWNQFIGLCGTFQCIPTGFLRYPKVTGDGVFESDLVFAEEAVQLSRDKRDDRRIGSPAYHFDHSDWYEKKQL